MNPILLDSSSLSRPRTDTPPEGWSHYEDVKSHEAKAAVWPEPVSETGRIWKAVQDVAKSS